LAASYLQEALTLLYAIGAKERRGFQPPARRVMGAADYYFATADAAAGRISTG